GPIVPRPGVYRPCARCRSKKTKCDRIKPACSNCQKAGLNAPCVYDNDEPNGYQDDEDEDDDLQLGTVQQGREEPVGDAGDVEGGGAADSLTGQSGRVSSARSSKIQSHSNNNSNSSNNNNNSSSVHSDVHFNSSNSYKPDPTKGSSSPNAKKAASSQDPSPSSSSSSTSQTSASTPPPHKKIKTSAASSAAITPSPLRTSMSHHSNGGSSGTNNGVEGPTNTVAVGKRGASAAAGASSNSSTASSPRETNTKRKSTAPAQGSVSSSAASSPTRGETLNQRSKLEDEEQDDDAGSINGDAVVSGLSVREIADQEDDIDMKLAPNTGSRDSTTATVRTTTGRSKKSVITSGILGGGPGSLGIGSGAGGGAGGGGKGLSFGNQAKIMAELTMMRPPPPVFIIDKNQKARKWGRSRAAFQTLGGSVSLPLWTSDQEMLLNEPKPLALQRPLMAMTMPITKTGGGAGSATGNLARYAVLKQLDLDPYQYQTPERGNTPDSLEGSPGPQPSSSGPLSGTAGASGAGAGAGIFSSGGDMLHGKKKKKKRGIRRLEMEMSGRSAKSLNGGNGASFGTDKRGERRSPGSGHGRTKRFRVESGASLGADGDDMGAYSGSESLPAYPNTHSSSPAPTHSSSSLLPAAVAATRRSTPVPTRPRTFACSFDGCGKSFMDKFHLDRHEKRHVTQEIVCGIDGCTKAYNSISTVRRHQSMVHKEYKERERLREAAAAATASGPSPSQQKQSRNRGGRLKDSLGATVAVRSLKASPQPSTGGASESSTRASSPVSRVREATQESQDSEDDSMEQADGVMID
ncbi:hypothetical protein BGW38_005902, partial [Lunasporangiospora selenospora]